MALPTHARCPHCGHEHRLPGYVYAHWEDTFTVTCESEKCGQQFTLYHGKTS